MQIELLGFKQANTARRRNRFFDNRCVAESSESRHRACIVQLGTQVECDLRKETHLKANVRAIEEADLSTFLTLLMMLSSSRLVMFR